MTDFKGENSSFEPFDHQYTQNYVKIKQEIVEEDNQYFVKIEPQLMLDEQQNANINNKIEEIYIKEEHRSPSPSSPTVKYQCNVCHKLYASKDTLRAHLGFKHGNNKSCDICLKQFKDQRDLINHVRTHTGEKPFECEICNKRFILKGGLAVHMRTHTGEKPYQCDICHKRFSQNASLKKHIRTHRGEKPFACDFCHKKFLVNDHLLIHRRKHTGQKPFACNFCHKSFSWKKNYTIHVRTHTGDKPYECNICQRRFVRNDALTVHTRFHTRDKPYKCDICHKRFVYKSSHKVHVRLHKMHNPYETNIRHKNLNESSNLETQIHEFTREEYKSQNSPYGCKLCGKSFPLASSLQKHSQIHTVRGLYECDVCNEQFKQNYLLLFHRRTHT